MTEVTDNTRLIDFFLNTEDSIPIAAPSYHPTPSAAMHGDRQDCNSRVFRARRQNASACSRRRCSKRADKGPYDRTTGRNCPRSAPSRAAIACASTVFRYSERTYAGAPCPVLIALGSLAYCFHYASHRLLYFCAVLMIHKRYFLIASNSRDIWVYRSQHTRASDICLACVDNHPSTIWPQAKRFRLHKSRHGQPETK